MKKFIVGLFVIAFVQFMNVACFAATGDPVIEGKAAASITVTGTLTAGGSDIQGGQTVNITPVTTATYDIQTTDYILHVTYTTTGPVTSLTLLTAQCVDGRIIRIKDAGGNAATNNITVDTEGSETIDGVSTFVLNTNGEAVDFYAYDGNWFVN